MDVNGIPEEEREKMGWGNTFLEKMTKIFSNLVKNLNSETHKQCMGKKIILYPSMFFWL